MKPTDAPPAEVLATPARSVRALYAADSLKIERRAGDDGPAVAIITGYSAVFDEWTTLYRGRYFEVREIIRPGAFSRALRDKQDVRALINHDPRLIIGRTTAGTLTLAEDGRGLHCVINPPDTQAARDLVVSIDRRDVTGQSFAFTPASPNGERITITIEGEREIHSRELLDVDLFDVGPVTYPAYEQTDVGLRALAAQYDQPRQGRGRLARMRMRARAAAHLKGD